MNNRPVVGLVVQVLLWVAGSSLAGAVVGFAVGLFNEGGIEAPAVIMSVLFGNVVGLTAMVSSISLFPRLRGLAPPLRVGQIDEQALD